MENMDKSMVDFVKKLTEDQALQERMSKATNPEEAYDIAKENGVTVSIDDFKETMKVVAMAAKGELSEEEMKSVSGGMSTLEGLGIIAGGTAIGGAVGSLAGAIIFSAVAAAA